MRAFRTDIRSPRSPAAGSAGYSLVELMIALGVLGVGLGLIATLFPSAMLENKDSVQDTVGTLMAENAVATCRTVLRHSGAGGLSTAVTGQLSEISSYVSLADRAYPAPVGKTTAQAGYTQQVGSLYYRPEDWTQHPLDNLWYPTARFGWLAAARNVRPANWQPIDPVPNDYQLVIVPYRKFNANDRPGEEIRFEQVSVVGDSVYEFGTTTPVTGGQGGPVILADTGAFAYLQDNAGKLNMTLSDSAKPAVPALRVIYNNTTDPPTTPPTLYDSPAIGCYVVRTGLAP